MTKSLSFGAKLKSWRSCNKGVLTWPGLGRSAGTLLWFRMIRRWQVPRIKQIRRRISTQMLHWLHDLPWTGTRTPKVPAEAKWSNSSSLGWNNRLSFSWKMVIKRGSRQIKQSQPINLESRNTALAKRGSRSIWRRVTAGTITKATIGITRRSWTLEQASMVNRKESRVWVKPRIRRQRRRRSLPIRIIGRIRPRRRRACLSRQWRRRRVAA